MTTMRYAGLLALLLSAGTACGGAIAPVGDAGDTGGGGEPDAAGHPDSAVDSSVITPPLDSSVVPPPFDSSVISFPDSALPPEDAPGCVPDGVPCALASQCCSNLCTGNICASAVSTCLPNGQGCMASGECCSGTCANNACVDQPPPPPPACPSGPTECSVCLAQSCCPEVGACLADATCNDFYACAQSCFGGSPANVLPCVQKCSPNPGTLETGLETCAVQSCAAACE